MAYRGWKGVLVVCEECGTGFAPSAPSSRLCGEECREKRRAARAAARRRRRREGLPKVDARKTFDLPAVAPDEKLIRLLLDLAARENEVGALWLELRANDDAMEAARRSTRALLKAHELMARSG